MFSNLVWNEQFISDGRTWGGVFIGCSETIFLRRLKEISTVDVNDLENTLIYWNTILISVSFNYFKLNNLLYIFENLKGWGIFNLWFFFSPTFRFHDWFLTKGCEIFWIFPTEVKVFEKMADPKQRISILKSQRVGRFYKFYVTHLLACITLRFSFCRLFDVLLRMEKKEISFYLWRKES